MTIFVLVKGARVKTPCTMDEVRRYKERWREAWSIPDKREEQRYEFKAYLRTFNHRRCAESAALRVEIQAQTWDRLSGKGCPDYRRLSWVRIGAGRGIC